MHVFNGLTYSMKIISFILITLFCFVLGLYKMFAYFVLGLSEIDWLKNLGPSSTDNCECGVLVIGFGPMIKTLLLLKVLQYGFVQFDGVLVSFLFHFGEKLRIPFSGFCSKSDFVPGFDSNCICGKSKLLDKSSPKFAENKVNVIDDDDDDDDDDDSDEGDEVCEEEVCNEDEVFDVLTLRKIIRTERRRADALRLELEKERMASASAAEEAMGVIMRLQNEKNSIEMASEQYRKIAEHKQMYDQEVIDSLRWLLSKHESQRSLAEDQLRSCRRKLKTFVKNIDEQFEGVDIDPNLSCSSPIRDDHDALFSSLEMELPQ